MSEATPSTANAPTPTERRATELSRLVDTAWDVVIVGGGIVGAGALLDAATRGLHAALIEQDDIASGTSSRSSRLIHGGLRYLEQLQIGLVREGLAERGRLLRNAPHLVTLEPQLFPDPWHPVPEQGVLRRGSDAVRPSGCPPRRRMAPPVERRRDHRDRPVPATQGPAWRVALPRRHGGRRPTGPRRRPYRACRGCPVPGRHPGPGPRSWSCLHVGIASRVARPRCRFGRGARDPDTGGRRRDRRLGGRSGAPVIQSVDPDPPEPRCPSRRASSADPDVGRTHDPRPRQGRLSHPVAGSLADRDHGRAL